MKAIFNIFHAFRLPGDSDSSSMQGTTVAGLLPASKEKVSKAAVLAAIETLGSGMDRKFNALGARIDGVETRLGDRITEVETRLGERIDGVETRLSGVETRLDGVETRLDGVETRLGGVESEVKEVRTEVKEVRTLLQTILDGQAVLAQNDMELKRLLSERK